MNRRRFLRVWCDPATPGRTPLERTAVAAVLCLLRKPVAAAATQWWWY